LFKLDELVNLILNSYDTVANNNNGQDSNPRRSNTDINNNTASISDENKITSFSVAVNINNMFDMLLANDSSQFENLHPDSLEVHYLHSGSSYSFFIRVHVVIDRVGVSRRFELVSETRSCVTKSSVELFGAAPMQLRSLNSTTLAASYFLNENLTNNYQHYKIYLNKVCTFNIIFTCKWGKPNKKRKLST
jgi:hypothetical protein